MSIITDQLTNRDIALFVWLGITAIGIAIFAIRQRAMRSSLRHLLRLVFFDKKLTPIFLLMVGYVALVVTVCYRIGLWQAWMLKDTVYWFFGSALVTFFNVTKASTEEHFFRKAVLDNVHFAALLGFFVNLYVFNLIIELLLLPGMTFLVALLVVATSKKEYAPTKTVLQGLIAIIGFGIFAHATVAALDNPQSLATLNNLEDFVLPLGLTLAFLPLIYVLALYVAYEMAYTRLKIISLSRDAKLSRFALWQTIKACRWHLRQIERFSKRYVIRVGHADTQAEVVEIINEFRSTTPAPQAED